jgi:hypothetical protein
MDSQDQLAVEEQPAQPLGAGGAGGPDTVRFASILCEGMPHSSSGARGEPTFFGDLNLDQVLESILAKYKDYELAPFFHEPLHDPAAVGYRHEILRDLEREDVSRPVRAFARRMVEMRKLLALVTKLCHLHQKQRWFLSAVAVYCDAVKSLVEELREASPQSSGLLGFRAYLDAYSSSPALVSIDAQVAQLQSELAEVSYAIALKGMRVTVSRYEDAPDLTAEIEATFAKFREGAVKDYRVGFRAHLELNHVEGQILNFVAALHPEVFARVREFCNGHQGFMDETIARFDREVHFYLAYLEYIEPLKAQGLPFCYPTVSSEDKTIRVRDAFDLPLARKLMLAREPVVCNEFELAGRERILVVTGPNQGGKTTFARMFGQLHHLAALGLPVPGSEARVFLPDQIFAHFEREEDLATLRSKFEDELVRLHEILQSATSDSILVMNESFTSTTLQDALFVGTQVLGQIIERDVVCVCVTFVDELASLGEETVSMMSTVSPKDPTIRTFKVVRKPADGLAYALAIAEKHGVGYERLKQRIET